MLNIPSELKAVFKTDYLPYRSEPVQKDLKFTFMDPSLVIENDKVVAGSFDLQESLNSNEDLVFGSCEAACLKVKFADITEDINSKTFSLTQTVNGEVINLGIFTVDSAIEQDNRRFLEVTAYDNIRKFDRDVVDWYESLTFPTSLKAMRESLCTHCSVEYEDSNLPNDAMTVTKTISSNTLNGLEVLRSLEQINGAFGHIGRDGKLQHKVLSKTVVDDTIPSGSYKTLKYEKYSTKPIDKLQILSEDGDIGAIVGTGTNCYQIQSNFLVYGKSASALQTIADNAAINILGITYVPYTCDMLGLPYLEVGDRVTYGTAITSYILSRNLKGIQSIKDSIETKGNEEIIQVKSINTEVKQLRGKTNVLSRDVEKMESTITEFDKQINVLLPGPWYPDGSLLPCQNNMTNLEYELNSKILQTAKEITTEVNNVSEQLNSQISQTATSITAQVNNLSANMSAQFAITDAEISTKVEKNGIISSINQSAESITIKAEKINLSGYVTFSGLSAGTTTIDGGCIRTGLIDAERIKVGTLTGFNLNGCNIYSSQVNATNLVVTDSNSETHIGFGQINIEKGLLSTYIGTDRIEINGTRVSMNGHTHSQYASTSHGHNSTEIYGVPTDSNNISMSGSLNAASVTYCQATFVRQSSSDLRLKRNVQDVNNVDNFYSSLKPKSYQFKGDLDDGYTHYGLLAQEVLSNAYSNNIDVNGLIKEYETRSYLDEGMYTGKKAYRVDYDSLHAFHISMIQKLIKRVNEMEERLCN